MRVCHIAPIHDYNDVRVVKKEYLSFINSGGDGILICATNKFNLTLEGDVNLLGSYNSRLKRFLKLPYIFYLSLVKNADIYHCHNPDSIPIALMLKVFGKNVIYDTHEDFSARILIRDWIPLLIRPLIAKLVSLSESLVCKVCDGFIVTQDGQLEKLSSQATLIRNFPVLQNEYLPEKKEQPTQSGVLRLVYIGGISHNRGILRILDLVWELNLKLSMRVTFNLAGPCDENLLLKLESHKAWEFTKYFGHVSQEYAFNIVKESDLGLLLIDDISDHRATSPNKLYEYCKFGLPFLANNFKSWMKSFDGCQSAFFVNVDNPEDIFNMIVFILDNFSSIVNIDDLNLFLQKNSWENEYIVLEKLYKKVLSS